MANNEGVQKKITIVGAGNVGATTAQLCAYKKLGHIVLVDILEGYPQGKALDISESAPLEHFDGSVMGTNDYKDTLHSDVVIVCSGLPRKPGMTREDLRDTNAEIIKSVTGEIIKHSPDCFMIVVTNPLDTMTYVARKYTNLPKHRIVGMAGILDSTRFRTFVAMELGVSREDVSAMVLGLHGPHMVPLPRYASVSGIPITELLSPDKVEEIAERTRSGGTEIVQLLKTGSAFYAPAASITQMVEAIVHDKKRVLPCAAYLEGEYGLNDIFMGVPVILGHKGVEKILELNLTETELTSLKKSADTIKASIAQLKV